MGKHSLPRSRAPFWTTLVIGGAVVVSATLAATTAPTVDYQHTAPAPTAQVQVDHDRDRRLAALLIEARMASHQPIEEDLTWAGMPAVVGQYNDEIMTRYGTLRSGALCGTDGQCGAWAVEVWGEPQSGPGDVSPQEA